MLKVAGGCHGGGTGVGTRGDGVGAKGGAGQLAARRKSSRPLVDGSGMGPALAQSADGAAPVWVVGGRMGGGRFSGAPALGHGGRRATLDAGPGDGALAPSRGRQAAFAKCLPVVAGAPRRPHRPHHPPPVRQFSRRPESGGADGATAGRFRRCRRRRRLMAGTGPASDPGRLAPLARPALRIGLARPSGRKLGPRRRKGKPPALARIRAATSLGRRPASFERRPRPSHPPGTPNRRLGPLGGVAPGGGPKAGPLAGTGAPNREGGRPTSPPSMG